MEPLTIQRYFFLGLFLGVTILTALIFIPFIKVIALAAILATLLYPLYKRLLKIVGGRRKIAAFLIILFSILIIVVPATLLGIKLFNETRGLYFQVRNSQVDHMQILSTLVEKPLRAINPNFNFNIQSYTSLAISWVFSHLNSFLTTTIQTFIDLGLLVISLFFFLKDGPKFKKAIIKLSPLNNSFDEQLFSQVEKTINSVIKGLLFVALIQGILAGIGLSLFGVNNGTLWGAVAAVCALVPGLGTALVTGPAILYLLFTGNIVGAIGLTLWGICVVGLVDNFLAPYLYSRGIKIHPLLILFAVLGGLVFFGPTGFLFGPIVLTLFLSLVDIYREFILGMAS